MKECSGLKPPAGPRYRFCATPRAEGVAAELAQRATERLSGAKERGQRICASVARLFIFCSEEENLLTKNIIRK